MEIWGGASLALLNKGKKFVCFYLTSRYTLRWTLFSLPWRLQSFDAVRSTWTWGARYSKFTLQHIGDFTYTPYLLAHAVLFLDTGSPTILSGWDAATISSLLNVFQTLAKYSFGVSRGKWREIVHKKKFISITRMGAFSRNRPSEKWRNVSKTLKRLGTT